jgi:hypothetical protein
VTVVGAAVVALLSLGSPVETQDEGQTLGRWLFDEGQGTAAGDGVDGAVNGQVVNATWGQGRSSGALLFEDYSLKEYLKPDVSRATRVIVPHHDRLNPGGPFTLRAVIYPTRDPLYYGGIFEKGGGYGASIRLMLLRGLEVRGTVGADHAAVTSGEPLSLDAWHEIELAYDGSSLVLKVDGKEQGRTAEVKGPVSSSADVVIGERFSGRIDEIVLERP